MEIIEGNTLKNFLAENLVMNYSNIEIHKLLFQFNGGKSGASPQVQSFSRSPNASGHGRSEDADGGGGGWRLKDNPEAAQ